MIAGFKQQVSTLVRWLISFVSNGRSERVTTHQQLVGRLAMQQLGSRTSAPLMRGETISPTGAHKPSP
jgi:NADH dehydrogenase